MAHPTGGYKINKKRVPGVTTIIGRFKESGGLLWWAFEQGKAAERGEINSLYDKRDEAAESGTLAHSMVEAHIDKAEPPCCDGKDYSEEVWNQAEAAFKSYLAWEKMTKLNIVDQEMLLLSKEYKFGGSPDAIGEIGGELCLIDWKTSAGIYADYLVQIAAYAILWEENHPDKPLLGGFHLCRFSKKHGDFSHHHYPNLDEAKQAFLLMRELYPIMAELKKRAK